MIKIDIKKFKSISFEDCINYYIDQEMDTYIKRVTSEIITNAKKKLAFNKMSENEQIEYFLKCSLLKIVPSEQWQKFSRNKDFSADGLYITLKRHYFLVTNNFPN